MRYQFVLFICLATPILGQEGPDKSLKPVEIPAVSSFSAPSEEKRLEVVEIVEGLSLSLLQVDQYVSTSKYQLSSISRIDATELHVGFSVGTSVYAENHSEKAVRKVLTGQPGDKDPDEEFEYKPHAIKINTWFYDQLKLGDTYFESTGVETTKSDEPHLDSTLRRRSFFHPLRAAFSSVTQTLAGKATDYLQLPYKAEGLLGVTSFGPDMHCYWRYKAPSKQQVLRFVTFRDGVPIQIEDRYGPWDKHEMAKLYARTSSRWKRFDDVGQLPVEVLAVRENGLQISELKFTTHWKFNSLVDSKFFDEKSIGGELPISDIVLVQD